MKSPLLSIGIVLILCNHSFIFAQTDRNKNIFLFEPDNISTEVVEYSASFSTSGTEMYFARSNGKWGTGTMKSSIYFSVKENGKWSSPRLTSFSGQFDDGDPHLTRDGNALYFISQRPSGGAKVSADIWLVKRDSKGIWGEPFKLDMPINSNSSEYGPRTDKNGNLYFASDRPGGYGQGDLYMAKLENGEFSKPINLGRTINSEKGEWNLEINGEGNLIIFEASQRPQNVSSYGDLYISYKQDNIWSVPQNIKELNTSGSDLFPQLTKKEKILFFTSSDSLKSVDTNIYFTKFRAIEKKYKRKAVFAKKP